MWFSFKVYEKDENEVRNRNNKFLKVEENVENAFLLSFYTSSARPIERDRTHYKWVGAIGSQHLWSHD